MKRSIIIAALFAAITTTVFIACKKEEEKKHSETANKSSVNNNMDEHLLTFKEKLQNAVKVEEYISIEQAERDLGNLLNFDFDDANYATDTLCVDTIRTSIPLINGKIDLYSLSSTYNWAFYSILAKYEAKNLPEKSVFSIQCIMDNESKDEYIDITIVLTTRGLTNRRLKTEFEEGECWKTINYGGPCNGNNSETYGAFQMIALLASNRLTLSNWQLDCSNGQRIVFDNNLNIAFIYGYDSSLDPNSPVGGHELYVSHTVFDTCLCYEALNYFLEKSIEIGDENKPNQHIIYGYASHLDGDAVHDDCGWQNLQVAYRRYWCSGEPVQY